MIDDEPRCTLTGLPKYGCAHCRGHRDPVTVDVDPLTREDLVGPTFPAGFPGTCAHCGGEIGAGAEIQRIADGSGYACPDCLP
jgi:hypothetical protein